MKRFSKEQKIIFYEVLGVIILFFLWWIISACINSTLFPTPITVFPVFFSFLAKGGTYAAIGGTFLRLLISLLISLLLGVILGAFAGYFYRFEAIMRPIIEFFKALPTAAIVLILIILLKPMWTPIIVSTLIMFPLFYEATLNGIKNISKDLKEEMKLYHASIFNSLFHLYIPMISPYLLLALVQSLGLGVKVSIMAEILCGSNQINGLGRLIQYEYMNANSTNVLAYSLIAVLMIVIIDIAFYFAKKKFKRKTIKTKE